MCTMQVLDRWFRLCPGYASVMTIQWNSMAHNTNMSTQEPQVASNVFSYQRRHFARIIDYIDHNHKYRISAVAKAKLEGLERVNVLNEQMKASIEAVTPDGYRWQSTGTAYSAHDARSTRGL